MREESHYEDMRLAIRGDCERLAERRGEQQLMHVSEPEPDLERPTDETGVESPSPRSWLSRFISP